MSGLGFLSVDAQDAVARSPMEGRARPAGASFAVRGGWNVAVAYGPDPVLERSFVERTVGFADRSSLGKFELHGVHGRALGMAERSDDGWWCPVTPARALVLGGACPPGTVVDVTCGLAALSLVGPAAEELLARFCAIDVRWQSMPVGAFRPGSVARTPGYVLREAPERLLVLAGSAFGEYLWDVVADAAEHLGGGPVGAEVLDA